MADKLDGCVGGSLRLKGAIDGGVKKKYFSKFLHGITFVANNVYSSGKRRRRQKK